MVACLVRDQEAVGSNPATPTKIGVLPHIKTHIKSYKNVDFTSFLAFGVCFTIFTISLKNVRVAVTVAVNFACNNFF